MELSFSEIGTIGAKLLLVRRYDSVTAGRTGPTKQRRAECYEMSWYLSGDGSVTINGVEYAIAPGYVRFVRPGDLVFSTPHFICLTVNFELSSEDKRVESRILSPIPPFFYGGREVGRLFAEMLESGNDGESCLIALSGLMRILAKLCEISKSSSYPSEVSRCIEYMRENYTSRLTLKRLAEESGYSAIHLHRLFVQYIGCTPHEYLTELRIRRAKELLAAQTCTLDEIAQSCGFGSPSHFKTVFRERVGKTPGAFRRELESMV